MAYKVFISHSSRDTWVARQLEKHATASGAITFIDSDGLKVGDEIDENIRNNLKDSNELLVLLTPAANNSPYVQAEIGAGWIMGLRLSVLLYGVEPEDMNPLIKGKKLYLHINNADDYFQQLSDRIKKQSP